jgi:hypothetical protein
VARNVTGAKKAAAIVLFDMGRAPGHQIQQDALRIGGRDHPLRACHPVRKSLDGLDPDRPDLATGQAGVEGGRSDRFDVHREEAFGDPRRPVVTALGRRNRPGIQDGSHWSASDEVPS